MASRSDAVKHAILAFAAVYVLDYVPSEQLRARAIAHYRRAAELVSKAITDLENVDINKANATIVAAIMVYSVDVCTYASRLPLSIILEEELTRMTDCELGDQEIKGAWRATLESRIKSRTHAPRLCRSRLQILGAQKCSKLSGLCRRRQLASLRRYLLSPSEQTYARAY